MNVLDPSIRIALSRPQAAGDRRRYLHEGGGWSFASVPQDDPTWTSSVGSPLPERLHALTPSDGGVVASWRAQVAWNDDSGERSGAGDRGGKVGSSSGSSGRARQVRQAALTVAGMAGPTRRERGSAIDVEHPVAVAAALPPGIAAQAPHQFARLSVGWVEGDDVDDTRDVPATLPARAESWLLSLPEEQRLLVWSREARDGEAAAMQTRVRVESDGRVLDPASWRTGFAALDRQVADALDRLRDRWGSAEAVSSTALTGRPALLAAESGVAWGYREGASLDVPPAMHMAGHLRGCLCRWALSWRGIVDVGGARARVRIDVVDDPALTDFQREWDLPWSHDSDAAALPWMSVRLPLRLTIEPEANAAFAFVSDIGWAGEAPALVVGVGLRPSSRGNGLEWAVVAALEPIAVRVGLSAPWSGRREQTLDWLLNGNDADLQVEPSTRKQGV